MIKLSGVGYLAGPMTGHPNWNYDEFITWAKRLRGHGYSINNPAEHFGGDQTLPRALYLRAAIVTLMRSDYVLCLPGWDTSRGASLEVDIALELGMPVYQLVLGDEAWSMLPLSLEPRPAVREIGVLDV